MPDHFHAIITINGRSTKKPIIDHRTRSIVNTVAVETPRRDISTNEWHATDGRDTNDAAPNEPNPFRKPQWQSGCLGAIINQFKSICTKRIRNAGQTNFAWQPRYHEHLIRTEQEMVRIRKYIVDNPSVWTRDHQ
jgi:hypothetical protein